MLWMKNGGQIMNRAQQLGYWQTQLMQAGRLQSTVVSSASGSNLSGDVRPFEDIPGPKGLPYFGTYFKYKLGAINIHKLFDTHKDWHHQYGGILKETCLGQTVVHISDPEAIRMVYATEGKRPSIEPLAEPTMQYRKKRGIALGLGNTNGEEWYRLRSPAQQLMMRPKEVVPFLPVTDQVAKDFVSHLKGLRNATLEVPDFETELGRWTLESAGMQIFNARLGYLTQEGWKEAEQVLAANNTMFEMLTKLFASFPIYQYTHIATPKWKKLFAAEDLLYDVFLKHFNSAVDRLREKMDSGCLEEGEFRFIRYLMSREELSISEVAILANSLLYDPLPTVKSQFQFLLYLLAVNPSAQDRLYEEIRSVAPAYPAPLTAETVAQMAYLRACFKESIRMMPVINESNRYTTKDLVLGGYHVPVNTLVFLNNYVLFRHSDFFADPDDFMPERWLKEESKQTIDPIIVLPFGHGPRMCVGRRFAEQGVAVLLIRLLQNFRPEWHHPPMGVKYFVLNTPDCPAQYTFCDR